MLAVGGVFCVWEALIADQTGTCESRVRIPIIQKKLSLNFFWETDDAEGTLRVLGCWCIIRMLCCRSSCCSIASTVEVGRSVGGGTKRRARQKLNIAAYNQQNSCCRILGSQSAGLVSPRPKRSRLAARREHGFEREAQNTLWNVKHDDS